MKILIKNGRLIDPANKRDEVCDILTENGRIAQVGKNIMVLADTIIDATNKIVIPGLIDMHVHLREPGREDKETIASGTKAALRGGITTVLAMPNTMPAMDSVEALQSLKAIIQKKAYAHVLAAGTMTQSRRGQVLTDISALKKEGIVAVSDDGDSVDNEGLMKEVLEKAAAEQILAICHCEDSSLSKHGVMNLGLTSTILGLRGIPKKAEYKMVERDLRLAKETGASVHLAHISCRESVELIAVAKKKGVRVTAEATPHHFTLTEEAVLGYDTNMKMNPPLRGKDDVGAIRQALKDGVLDVIASDHAPHTENEKEIEFDRAEFGVVGLETSLSVAVTELVDKKILDWAGLVEKMSVAPAKILNLNKGALAEGRDADIIVVDPEQEWTVTPESFFSKCKNSAFLGRTLKGVVEYSICGGRLAYQAGHGFKK
ncbi:MAG: dihydroorotase [Candidatus Omnitrophota bacterium]